MLGMAARGVDTWRIVIRFFPFLANSGTRPATRPRRASRGARRASARRTRSPAFEPNTSQGVSFVAGTFGAPRGRRDRFPSRDRSAPVEARPPPRAAAYLDRGIEAPSCRRLSTESHAPSTWVARECHSVLCGRLLGGSTCCVRREVTGDLAEAAERSEGLVHDRPPPMPPSASAALPAPAAEVAQPA